MRVLRVLRGAVRPHGATQHTQHTHRSRVGVTGQGHRSGHRSGSPPGPATSTAQLAPQRATGVASGQAAGRPDPLQATRAARPLAPWGMADAARHGPWPASWRSEPAAKLPNVSSRMTSRIERKKSRDLSFISRPILSEYQPARPGTSPRWRSRSSPIVVVAEWSAWFTFSPPHYSTDSWFALVRWSLVTNCSMPHSSHSIPRRAARAAASALRSQQRANKHTMHLYQ